MNHKKWKGLLLCLPEQSKKHGKILEKQLTFSGIKGHNVKDVERMLNRWEQRGRTTVISEEKQALEELKKRNIPFTIEAFLRDFSHFCTTNKELD